jgi:hypothetical protein
MSNSQVRYREAAVRFLDTYFKTLRKNMDKRLEEEAIKSRTMMVDIKMAMKYAEALSLSTLDEKN